MCVSLEQGALRPHNVLEQGTQVTHCVSWQGSPTGSTPLWLWQHLSASLDHPPVQYLKKKKIKEAKKIP